MTLTAFDHVNVRTARLSAMVAWYADVLGLQAGDRPAFPFPGAWLYLGGAAVIHLVGVEDAPVSGGDIALEHIAFRATGMEGFLQKLKDLGLPYQLNRIDSIGVTQVNIHDPDGNHIHVDFETPQGA